MSNLIKLSMRKHNLRRAIILALVVGTLLAVINHYDTIMDGQISNKTVMKILVTYLVPFVVSLTSSTLADRKHQSRS
jgi:hypothetical protein